MVEDLRQMRIAVIASYAPSLVIFRGALLATLSRAGHQILACAPVSESTVPQKLREIGVMYQSIELSRTSINPLDDVKTLLSLYEIFQRFKPDIVLGYTIKPVVYASLAARFAGVPRSFSIITGLGFAFVEPENTTGGQLKRRIVNRLVRLLYRLALSWNEKVFFQNPDDRAHFVQLELIPKEKTVLINGSGVDLDYFVETPPPTREFPLFLLIARLLKDKGILEYVEAASILKKQYPDVEFRLLGWFDENNPAGISRVQLEEWQREGHIKYLGSTEDVRPFLREASVYVLPSYREGTPRTVLEAMAIGRPIVTTDAPGCRETVIHGENGFLVPVRDVPSLVNTLEKFIHQPELIATMGRRSREIAEEKYDVHKVNTVILQTMGLEDAILSY